LFYKQICRLILSQELIVRSFLSFLRRGGPDDNFIYTLKVIPGRGGCNPTPCLSVKRTHPPTPSLKKIREGEEEPSMKI